MNVKKDKEKQDSLIRADEDVLNEKELENANLQF